MRPLKKGLRLQIEAALKDKGSTGRCQRGKGREKGREKGVEKR